MASDPWRDTAATLVEGARVRGKVTRLQPFGAFVEIAPGVEGLVHISELGAGRRINHPKEVVSAGQEIEAVVLSIDPERHRIGLSMASSSDGNAEDIAALAKSQGPAQGKLGTFADLLKKH